VDLDEYKNRPESLKKEVDARSALWLAALVENYSKQYRFEGEDLYTVPEEVALKGPKSNTNLEYKV